MTVELIIAVLAAFLLGVLSGAYLAFTAKDYPKSDDPNEWYGSCPLSLAPGVCNQGRADELAPEIKEYLGL